MQRGGARVLLSFLLVCSSGILGCAGHGPSDPASGSELIARDGGAVRGPISLDFDPDGNGDPISVVWDDASAALYVADNRNNQIWSWTDRDSFKKLATVPDDPVATEAGRTNLGQIVRKADGTLVVPRFGFGEVGAIVYVNPTTHEAGNVAGVPPTRKRTGLTAGPDGQLWGSYFLQPGDGRGTVTKVSSSGEVDHATGFQKPVAVLALDGRLLVSDQKDGIIYALSMSGDAAPRSIFARVPSCDALTAGPHGSVITGQYKPLADGGPLQIRQAFPDGNVRVLFPEVSFAKPQGVAYDKTHRRLFVADSNGTLVRTIKILPLE